MSKFDEFIEVKGARLEIGAPEWVTLNKDLAPNSSSFIRSSFKSGLPKVLLLENGFP